jgi:hypothetical protein
LKDYKNNIRVTFGDWIIQTPATSQKKLAPSLGPNKRGDWQEKNCGQMAAAPVEKAASSGRELKTRIRVAGASFRT